MKWIESTWLPTWIIKIIRYEFWPWQVFYYPLYPYLIFLFIKYNKAFAFSAINPGVSLDSGLFTASKSKILEGIPENFKPKEGLLLTPLKLKNALTLMKKYGIDYPIICKPNIGERGDNVEMINSELSLKKYLENSNKDIVVQEYITWKEEFGVTFFKHPITSEIMITSIAQKEFLHVIGTGKDTVLELLSKNLRGRIFLNTIKKKYSKKLDLIPSIGEYFIVEPIGNHCRGTKFINRNDLITSNFLHEKVKKVVLPLIGFHFGRIDLKTQSIQELVDTKVPFKVFEINAVHAEPSHIYDPDYSIFRAYKDLYTQWNRIYAYGKICVRQGSPCLSLKRFITLVNQRHKNNLN